MNWTKGMWCNHHKRHIKRKTCWKKCFPRKCWHIFRKKGEEQIFPKEVV